MKNLFTSWKQDVPASLVVFLVALPLCLGVALASTGDKSYLFSGIISGTVGGIVVGYLSKSSIGVSGPAAGLITIVAAAIASLGSFENFLVAVILAGFIQLICGFLGAGIIGNYFPSSVIKGMLAAIGLTLILKEIPHAFGYDVDFMGDEAFKQTDGQNTFSEIFIALKKTSPGAIIITTVTLLVLILFERPMFRKSPLFRLIPGALTVVIIGVLINSMFKNYFPNLYLDTKHLVEIPKTNSLLDFQALFNFPNFQALKNPQVYIFALTIALVGSLETLLSVEATDKLDPMKNLTPTNRELKAQGVGNMIAGFLGGLPITQVIVRSSANVSAGGRSKLSAIMHGFLLISAVLLIPSVLNLIPLSVLAGILIMLGYKLSRISLYKYMYKLGWYQFLPFIATVLAILFTNLLVGICIGMFISLLIVIYSKTHKFTSYRDAIFHLLLYFVKRNYVHNVHYVEHEDGFNIIFKEKVTFLHKRKLKKILASIPENTVLLIDGSKCKSIDYDILELIEEYYHSHAETKNVSIQYINIPKIKIIKH